MHEGNKMAVVMWHEENGEPRRSVGNTDWHLIRTKWDTTGFLEVMIAKLSFKGKYKSAGHRRKE